MNMSGSITAVNTKQVHVAQITTVHPPFDTRIFHKQAKTLARAGYDVTLIARHARDETIDGIRVAALPVPRNRLSRMFVLTWKAFREALRQRADVYHIHDPELLPMGVVLKLLTRKPVLYDIHENVLAQIRSKAWIPRALRPVMRLVYQMTEGALLRFADAIILAEDSYHPRYRGHGNCVIVHNYPIVSMRKKLPTAVAHAFRVVYVGGVSELRGALTMAEAARVLKERDADVQWAVIGPIQSDDFQQVLQHTEIDVPGFKVIGALPFDEAQHAIANADVGLAVLKPVPNYVESLPTKLLEYMMAGIPVIASDFPLWREIVEGNRCGLTVDPLDPRAIADAICYLIEHPDEAVEMGRRGRQAVEQKYNWRQEEMKLLELYGSLLGGRGK